MIGTRIKVHNSDMNLYEGFDIVNCEFGAFALLLFSILLRWHGRSY